jgi:hypothetical protein
MTKRPDETPVQGRTRRRRSARLGGGLGLVIIGLVVLVTTVVQQVQVRDQADAAHEQAARSQRVTACQVRFNDAYAKVTKFRAALNDQDRAATIAFQGATGDLIHDVFHLMPGPDQAAAAEAAEAKYERARATFSTTEKRITAERKSNEFPELPSAACS